jgi:UDP-N-acetylmuramate--alanine ligase
LNIDADTIAKALKSFTGVKRRFEYHIKRNDLVFIDDYAHHPRELTAFISSVKKIFPGKKITGIFQPHLYTRTRDFATEFIKALSLLDETILLDIYPARELPIEGVSSMMLLEGITTVDKKLLTKEDLLLHMSTAKLEVVLTMGAGDIELLVDPIKNILEGRKK